MTEMIAETYKNKKVERNHKKIKHDDFFKT